MADDLFVDDFSGSAELKIPPIDSLIVDVAKDPPLEMHTEQLLALAPYKPEDRNVLLRKGFGERDPSDEPPKNIRVRATPNPAFLKGIDVYGGDLNSTFSLYKGGDDAAYHREYGDDIDAATDPQSYFELADD